jgi:transglutaminase-like putative cysteine protease
MKQLSILTAILILLGCSTQKPDEKSSVSKPKKTTIAEIEIGIRDYIDRETQKSEGVFPLPYAEDTMKLKLVRVHTEYLSNLGPGRHFACVDLADDQGDVYDVDFFLEGKPGAMTVTETTVHKKNGQPFYSWKQLKDKTWTRVAIDSSDKALLGVVERKDEFIFRYEVLVPELNDSARIWIPIASSNDFQTVSIIEREPKNRGELKREEKYGNQYWYMDLAPSDSEMEILIEYDVERLEKGPYEDRSSDPGDYLGSSPLLPTGGRFNAILDEVLVGHRTDSKLMQARAIYDFVIDTVRYRKAGEYGTGDANYACDSGSGNCTEFHSYFITLARSAGIPARFAIGAAIPSERNEGGVNGYHCWAEFYADEKWWPVDISEADKYSDLATYYFGHHPANRLEFSRGRDLTFSPTTSSGSIPFFAYPVLEEQGIERSAQITFTFERKKEIS